MALPIVDHRKIIERLINELPVAATDYKCKAWTTAIKQLMHKFASEELEPKTWEFCGSLILEDRVCYEWLFDVAWYVKTPNQEGIVLALESEWAPNLDEISTDFCKLLATKAPVKIFLFEAQKGAVERLNEILGRWQQHTPGEIIYAINFSNSKHTAWSCEIESKATPKLSKIATLSGPDNQATP